MESKPTVMKRFDVEQFLTLTLVLATAGAVGVGVYSSLGDDEPELAPQPEVEQTKEDFPQAEPDEPAPVVPPVPPVPATGPSPAPAPMPALDSAPEVLDGAPGPQVESMNW